MAINELNNADVCAFFSCGFVEIARGYGLRVVGGCNIPGTPGNLRARVARVTPGSGADFAGIRRGDIVLSWSGVKLGNMTFEEVCKILDASGDTVELNIASLERYIVTFPVALNTRFYNLKFLMGFQSYIF